VVLYGARDNCFTAYAHWLLRFRDFDGARLLNGAHKKWQHEGAELVKEVPDLGGTAINLRGPSRDGIRALRGHVLVDGEQNCFVDAWSPEDCRDDLVAPVHLPQEEARVPGHIPGALNIPWARVANTLTSRCRNVLARRGLGESSYEHPSGVKDQVTTLEMAAKYH